MPGKEMAEALVRFKHLISEGFFAGHIDQWLERIKVRKLKRDVVEKIESFDVAFQEQLRLIEEQKQLPDGSLRKQFYTAFMGVEYEEYDDATPAMQRQATGMPKPALRNIKVGFEQKTLGHDQINKVEREKALKPMADFFDAHPSLITFFKAELPKLENINAGINGSLGRRAEAYAKKLDETRPKKYVPSPESQECYDANTVPGDLSELARTLSIADPEEGSTDEEAMDTEEELISSDEEEAEAVVKQAAAKTDAFWQRNPAGVSKRRREPSSTSDGAPVTEKPETKRFRPS